MLKKMEAIGTLAGGLAHDFNNLLQVVQGYGELILLGKAETDPDHKQIKEILRSTKRGSGLIRKLLTFSRKVESEKRPLDLNSETAEIKKLLERTIPKMIDIKLNLGDELMIVNADSVQIEQVVMNIAVNAKDAMPEGGTLCISTENTTLDADYCRTHARIALGDYVLLTISDTGHGMDQETIDHIFEPFYTTKDPTRGTGLGLAIVYGIVENHQGHIVCESRLGEGTTFKIYLPARQLEMEMARAIKSEEPLKSGAETILIVEDEKAIRKLAEQILTKFGYTALTASDGESALEIYRQKKEHIDLVMLDLIMPGMGGIKCLEKLHKSNPDVKVVIASGVTPKGAAKKTLEAAATGFIRKPYDMRQMLEQVHQVLNGS